MTSATSSSSASSSSSSALLPAHYSIPFAQKAKMERIYKEEFRLASESHNLYTYAGIGAGISIAWALVEPSSLLGTITTLFIGYTGGSIIGSYFGFQKEFYPSSFAGNSPLEKNSLDTAVHIASFLTLTDLAQLNNVSQTTRYQVVTARNKTKELDLSNSPVSNEGLQALLKHYTTLRSLKVKNCKNITEDGTLLLADTLKTKSLVRFHFELLNKEIRFPPRQWWIPLHENLNFSRLESFICPYYTEDLPASFLEKISSSHLKRITCWPFQQELLSEQQALSWLQALPETLEHLDLHHVVLTSQMADLIMKKFNPTNLKPTNLKSCMLRFSADDQAPQITLPEIQQLLEFLPLSEMTEIELIGTQFTPADIQQIASRIAQNKQLKTLIVDPRVSAKDMYPLVLSLNMPTLNIVRLGHALPQLITDFRLKTLLKYRLIFNSALSTDKPSWRLSRNYPVGTTAYWDYSHDFFDDAPLLAEARELLHVIDHLGENMTDRQTQLAGSLKAHLALTPMPHILKHYSNLYNILHPNEQITPVDTLQMYGELANPQENLSQITTSLELIQRLEQLLQIEEEQINDPTILHKINNHLFFRHEAAKASNVPHYI